MDRLFGITGRYDHGGGKKNMKVLTATQMREVDRQTVQAGIPSIILMENAANRVVEFLAERFAPAFRATYRGALRQRQQRRGWHGCRAPVAYALFSRSPVCPGAGRPGGAERRGTGELPDADRLWLPHPAGTAPGRADRHAGDRCASGDRSHGTGPRRHAATPFGSSIPDSRWRR